MRPAHNAKLHSVGLASDAGTFVTRSVPELQLVLGGIEGDRHFGVTMKAGVRQPHFPRGVEVANTRQLSIVGIEELALVARELETDVTWQALGANLAIEGVADLTRLAPSSRLVF